MERKTLETSMGTVVYWTSFKDVSKPWIVFLPGLTADHTLFEKQTEYFSESWNCIVWDAPAHGLSRPFTLSFSMMDMATWLHEIVVKESAASVVLIGQSLGGYLAQVFLDRYSGMVSGFVSIDSCSLSRKYYTWWELALLKHTEWIYRSIPYPWLKKWGIAGTSMTAYGRSLMEQQWSVYNKDEYCKLVDHGYRIFAETVEAQNNFSIRCPVLLLCGTKDMAGSAKRYNRNWAKQDGHTLIWLEGAGHNANTDVPNRVNSLIEDFLSDAVKI